MGIGRLIRYYRELHNLTQSEAAELSGINEKYFGRLERDESVPTIDKIEQLCMAFDIRVCDLLMIDPDKIVSHCIDNEDSGNLEERDVYYCNCCGCAFYSDDSTEIRCPNCGCLYGESNNYIEKSKEYIER